MCWSALAEGAFGDRRQRFRGWASHSKAASRDGLPPHSTHSRLCWLSQELHGLRMDVLADSICFPSVGVKRDSGRVRRPPRTGCSGLRTRGFPLYLPEDGIWPHLSHCGSTPGRSGRAWQLALTPLVKTELAAPLPPLDVGKRNPNRNRDRYPNRTLMALGHEKLDVYRLAISYVTWFLNIPRN